MKQVRVYVTAAAFASFASLLVGVWAANGSALALGCATFLVFCTMATFTQWVVDLSAVASARVAAELVMQDQHKADTLVTKDQRTADVLEEQGQRTADTLAKADDSKTRLVTDPEKDSPS